MNDIIGLIQEYGFSAIAALLILGTCIQISPIKINPLSWIGKMIKKGLSWFGRQLTSELAAEIKETQSDLKEHLVQADKRFEAEEKARDIGMMKQLRWEILSFGISVKTEKYRKEEFDHIFEAHEDYEKLIKKNGVKNGQTDRAMALIHKVYAERQNDPDF